MNARIKSETRHLVSYSQMGGALTGCENGRSSARGVRRLNMTADANRIPSEFRPLLPLARTWGITDELDRCDFLDRTPLRSRREMVSAVLPHLDALEQWCAGQFRRERVSRETLQLSLLCMAATEAMYDVYLGD